MKGIFYSLIVALLMAPLVMLAVSTMETHKSSYSLTTTKTIGDKLVAYSRSIGDDLPRAMPIMAKRSISDAVVYIDTSGAPLGDASAALSELIVNGTLYGNVSSVDFTITSWANILKQKGGQYGFAADVKLIDIRFYQPDSYTVSVETSIGINVTNSYAKMEFYRVYNTTSPISIEGFNDPLYTLKTNGIIKRSVISPNMTVSGQAAFDQAVYSGFYMPSSDGAGFLDRMEGRLRGSGKYNTTNTGGLESVAYLPDLQANGFVVDQTKTDIDYMYFDSTHYSGSPANQSDFAWLKIDAAHAAIYNLTTL